MKELRRYKLPIIIVSILLLAAFLRLYRIADYMTFLGDEGRDALVVKGILEGNLVFLGPRASAGDFFLGPIYYYFMAPFLWLFQLNPVGPAIMVALLGVATVYLVYHVGKEFFGTKAGLITAILYAVSPLVIQFSRSSWNPNPVPFFTLLMMYLLYKAVKQNSWFLYLCVGVLFGILMQLHYIVVFLGIIIPLYVIIGRRFHNKKEKLTEYVIRVLTAGGEILAGFLIGFFPFLAFEVKNGFPNLKTISSFVIANLEGKVEGSEIVTTPLLGIVSNVFVKVFGYLLLSYTHVETITSTKPSEILLWQPLISLLAIALFIALVRTKDRLVILLLFLWIGLGIILFGFYKKPIYNYYFGFLFPAPFLLMGNFLTTISEDKRFGLLGKLVAVLIFLFILRMSFIGSPLRAEPNRQLLQMKSVSEFVLSKTENKPFNFALIAEGNSDHAYRYFFSTNKRDPVTIEPPSVDPERKTVTAQLMIICEPAECQPLGHPLFEVAAFGRGEIEGQWMLSVDHGRLYETPEGEKPFIGVYKLRHYEGEE
jgi:4-amino-4-deoxy-L-arabinose transferase-like glycosyltransferase